MVIPAASMNEIKFICHDKNVLKNFPIVPAKDCLPKWYNNMEGNNNNIKNDVPVGDYITSGYIIPNAFEQVIGIMFEGDIQQPEVVYPVERPGEFYTFLNRVNSPDFFHGHDYCPIQIEGMKKTYYKIKLPWRIETPTGYSTMFFQPFYQFNTDFFIMPFVLDTDLYDKSNIVFPCYIRNETDIKPGVPLVQCVPLKRESWKHSLHLEEERTSSKMQFYLKDMYKRAFHQKKSFN